LLDTKKKLKYSKNEDSSQKSENPLDSPHINNTNEEQDQNDVLAENKLTSDSRKFINKLPDNNKKPKENKKNNLDKKSPERRLRQYPNLKQALLKTRSLSPPASLKHILSMEYKSQDVQFLHKEEESQEETKEDHSHSIEKSIDNSKSERKSIGVSQIFAESSKKIATLEKNEFSRENFE
jgi:hypothetical protein